MHRYLFAITVLAAMFLVACGQADEPRSASPDAGTPSATATSEPVASPTAEPEPSPTAVVSELAGTRWVWSALNGNLFDAPAEVTLNFGDGYASGSSGCNSYAGAYSTSASGEFSMPVFESTAMDCAEPEGVMEHEATYVAALASVTSFVTSDDELTLSSENASTELIFTREGTPELTGVEWNVIVVDDEAVIEGTTLTMTFDDGQVSGSAGCNSFGGTFEVGGDGMLTIGDVQSTLMFCVEPAGVSEQEQAFLLALDDITTYEFDAPIRSFPERLRVALLDDGGRVRIVLSNDDVRFGVGPLHGTNWVLTSMYGETPTGTCPTTLSLVGSQYDGEYECKAYAGSINTTPDGRIIELRSWGDDGNLSAYETAFLSAVQYRNDAEGLALIDAEGVVALRYRPAEPFTQGLTDTNWRMVMLNGKERVPESVVTLEFSEYGLGGESGCNSYGSSLIVSEPGVISIPGGAMTEMACEDPAGVMEQETEFAETLFGAVVGYRITGTTLELLDADGAVVIVFENSDS